MDPMFMLSGVCYFATVPSKRPKIIDAEFEVIEGPYRIGDEHRTRKRWYWTGTYSKRGVPLWYRPPRFNKWQFAGIGVLVMILGLCFLVTYWKAKAYLLG